MFSSPRCAIFEDKRIMARKGIFRCWQVGRERAFDKVFEAIKCYQNPVGTGLVLPCEHSIFFLKSIGQKVVFL